ncbi:MAG TPA: DUF3662 and FHA domain-containing protein [Ktedonobacterales bacterium]|nr:DUF3662 and FHA domain-containing protein [Ktedonobacterales bacterium]
MSNLNVLGRFEAKVQALVEGSFGRVFRARVQPVEVARRLERAMDQNLTISPDRRTAANVYEVYLNARDGQQFGAVPEQELRRLQDDLIAIARRRGYLLLTRPIITFHTDDRLVSGQVRVEAHLVAPQALAEGAVAGDGAPALEATREMSPEEAQQLARELENAPAAEPLPQAWLTLRRPDGGVEARQLDRPVIHIGRHTGNEIMVNDKRVSRYHAEIRYERGQFVLYDLGSLNGVTVNGVVTHQPVTLRNNDHIAVGNHQFIFQRR